MNLEEKKKRLAELKRIPFPSDQDYNEIEQLQDELALEYEDKETIISEQEPLNRTVFEFVADKIKEKRGKEVKQRFKDPKKKSVIKKVIGMFQEKPVTQEEIDELKKLVYKYRLKADIAKSKAIINKSKTGKLVALERLFVDDHGTSKRKSSGNNWKTFYDNEDLKEKINYRRKTLGYR